MKLNRMIESRLEEMKTKRSGLIEGWSLYVNAAAEYLKESEGKVLSDWDKGNMAQCLENALFDNGLRMRSRIFETTYADNIQFLGIQLPVIAALVPSLVLNELAVVQTLDRRQGSVFFMNVNYGQDKGSIVGGSTMIHPKTGHAIGKTARMYSSDTVFGEGIGAAGSTAYSANLAYTPVKAGTASVTDGVETFTDNGQNVMVSNAVGGTNGTIDYASGLVVVTFKVATTVAPTAIYDFLYEKSDKGVAEVNFELTQEPLAAKDFTLRSKYTLGAAIDLEKAHGIVFEDEVVKFLSGEIKFEIDHNGIDQIDQAAGSADAADPVGDWSATISGGQEWLWKKFELLDRLEKGANNVFAKTQRCFPNVIVAGNNVVRVFRQLEPHFKPASGLEGNKVPKGPYVAGKLDGKTVIHDPFMQTNRYVLAYKGDDILNAGFIYAPYIPLFSTPTLITSDLKAQKGFMSAAGYKVVNPGMFTFGTVSGLA